VASVSVSARENESESENGVENDGEILIGIVRLIEFCDVSSSSEREIDCGCD